MPEHCHLFPKPLSRQPEADIVPDDGPRVAGDNIALALFPLERTVGGLTADYRRR